MRQARPDRVIFVRVDNVHYRGYLLWNDNTELWQATVNSFDPPIVAYGSDDYQTIEAISDAMKIHLGHPDAPDVIESSEPLIVPKFLNNPQMDLF